MTVSASASRSHARVDSARRRFNHCGRRRAGAAHREVDLHPDRAAEAVQTPSGPDAADEALAWLARQFSWQSTFAELEAGARPVEDRPFSDTSSVPTRRSTGDRTMDLQDKVVIVTGASRGIGRQIALELGRRGAKVALAARTVEPRRALPGTLGETVGLIESDGGTAVAVQCDVTKAADLERLVATTVDTFGRLDVVVNNAADMAGQDLESLVARMIGSPEVAADGAEGTADRSSPPDDGPLDNWHRQFATNVHAPYLLMGLAIPHLRAQGGGVIVNITSSVAEMVSVAPATSPSGRPGMINPGSLGYATTKAALNRLTNAAAADLAADNIAVVAVDPGETRTEVVDLLGDRGLLDADQWAPTSIPVGTVLDVLTADDPMAFSGTVIQAQPR